VCDPVCHGSLPAAVLTAKSGDILASVLPEEFHDDLPASFNTAGHVGTFLVVPPLYCHNIILLTSRLIPAPVLVRG